MVMLNGNILWMCGVEVKVKDLFTDNSGYTIAETVRPY